MWNKLTRWWATEGETVHLLGLDDRLLADIGLQRDGLRARIKGDLKVSDVAKAESGAVVCKCS